MTTTESNEFFAAPSQDVGGDTDQTSPPRLQTKRPDRRTQGRILITLHYDVPREAWGDLDTDAVDVLRREVDSIENVTQWFANQNNVSHREEISAFVTDVEVEAAK